MIERRAQLLGVARVGIDEHDQQLAGHAAASRACTMPSARGTSVLAPSRCAEASASARSPGLGSACSGRPSERRRQAFDHAAPAPAASAGAEPSTAARQVTRVAQRRLAASAARGPSPARRPRSGSCPAARRCGPRHSRWSPTPLGRRSRCRWPAGSARRSRAGTGPRRRLRRSAASPCRDRRRSDPAVEHHVPGQHARAHVDRAAARHAMHDLDAARAGNSSRSTASAATWLRPSSTHAG